MVSLSSRPTLSHAEPFKVGWTRLQSSCLNAKMNHRYFAERSHEQKLLLVDEWGNLIYQGYCRSSWVKK